MEWMLRGGQAVLADLEVPRRFFYGSGVRLAGLVYDVHLVSVPTDARFIILIRYLDALENTSVLPIQ